MNRHQSSKRSFCEYIRLLQLEAHEEASSVRRGREKQTKRHHEEKHRVDQGPNLFWKGHVSIIAFRKDFSATYDAFIIHEDAVMGLFKRYLFSSIKAVTMPLLAVRKKNTRLQNRRWTWSSTIVNHLLKPIRTKISQQLTPISETSTTGNLTAPDTVQELWTKASRCSSVVN